MRFHSWGDWDSWDYREDEYRNRPVLIRNRPVLMPGDGYWKTLDGSNLQISSMTEGHLYNCLQLLLRRAGWGLSFVRAFALDELDGYPCTITAWGLATITFPKFRELVSEAQSRRHPGLKWLAHQYGAMDAKEYRASRSDEEGPADGTGKRPDKRSRVRAKEVAPARTRKGNGATKRIREAAERIRAAGKRKYGKRGDRKK